MFISSGKITLIIAIFIEENLDIAMSDFFNIMHLHAFFFTNFLKRFDSKTQA